MNRIQIVIFGTIGVLVLVAVLLLTGVLPGVRPRQGQPVTLQLWGVDDDPALWQEIANIYREEVAPGTTINYQKKDPQTYETELVNALASGKGPDMFLLSDGWLGKHADKVTPLPDGMNAYQKKNLKSIFADGVAEAIVTDEGALLGTPLAFDTLALFYNRDYFNSANIPNPPQTWEELVTDAQTLTKRSEVGSITRSGVALGTASNVEHAADIFLALLYQEGGAVIDRTENKSALKNQATQSSLLFYTSFASSIKKTYAWNAFFERSLTAFAKGDAAMAFGFSADVPKVAGLNPQLNFDVAPLPQTLKSDVAVNYGRFDLWTVSRLSKNQEPAWNFLLWLENGEVEKKYIDARGLPPARRDLVSSRPPREYLTVFYDQVLSARTPPVVLGDSLPKIINDMIEAVVNRKATIDQAISRAESEINALLRESP